MKIVAILKAQGIGDRKVESAKIVMTEEMPDCKTLEEACEFYQEQAVELADVLCQTLPGGILDRLLIELLKRKVSLLIVPMFDK
jgi:hypothetical protein